MKFLLRNAKPRNTHRPLALFALLTCLLAMPLSAQSPTPGFGGVFFVQAEGTIELTFSDDVNDNMTPEQSIPVMSPVGVAVLALGLALAGGLVVRRRRSAVA
ncbi:MAG: hypothetical protein AAGI11_04770 [Pseudomonadota bacterium]